MFNARVNEDVSTKNLKFNGRLVLKPHQLSKVVNSLTF